MGAVTGMLGLGGGASGTGFAGPGSAGFIPTVSQQTINNASQYSADTMSQQQGLLQALQRQNGLNNQSQVYGQLQGVANGVGPNPAQAQYQQNIQSLAAQQQGALASIKGISPALQARLVAEQGSSAMQNAAAAGETNLMNQQLGAIGAAGNIAGTQATNQIGQTNANTAAAQNQQGLYQQAAANYNNSIGSMQGNINSTNAAFGTQQMQAQQKAIGGIANGLGAAFGAQGGEVLSVAPAASGPQSTIGKFFTGFGSAFDSDKNNGQTKDPLQGGVSNLIKSLKSAPAVIGNQAGSPIVSDSVAYAANGGMAANGGKVMAKGPAQKAVKSGNSYSNDKVPAMLSEGEVVIPRNIMQSADPARGAAQFVQAVLAKKQARGKI